MKHQRVLAILSALMLLVVGAGIANADQLRADGNSLVAGLQSGNPAAVDLAPGQSHTFKVAVQVVSTGGANSPHVSFPVGVRMSTSGSILGTPSPTTGDVTAYDTAGQLPVEITATAPGLGDLSCGLNSLTGKLIFDATTDTDALGTNGTNAEIVLAINVQGVACPDPNASPSGAANSAPTVSDAADDADGTEGDTLSSSGSFTDADDDALTLTADNTEGDFTDNGDGTWTWSMDTTDDVTGGTITITASDGEDEASDDFTYSAANADPEASATWGTAGANGCTVALNWGLTDAGTDDTHEVSVDWGDGSALEDLTGTSSPASHGYLNPGSYDATVTVTDDDGGSDEAEASDHAVTYSIGQGILSPFKAGVRNIVKAGNVVPVKIRLSDCAGGLYRGATLSIKVVSGNVTPETESGSTAITATTVSSADTTGFLRLTDEHYMYNLSTKGLTLETDYTIVIKDGTNWVDSALIRAKK